MNSKQSSSRCLSKVANRSSAPSLPSPLLVVYTSFINVPDEPTPQRDHHPLRKMNQSSPGTGNILARKPARQTTTHLRCQGQRGGRLPSADAGGRWAGCGPLGRHGSRRPRSPRLRAGGPLPLLLRHRRAHSSRCPGRFGLWLLCLSHV